MRLAIVVAGLVLVAGCSRGQEARPAEPVGTSGAATSTDEAMVAHLVTPPVRMVVRTPSLVPADGPWVEVGLTRRPEYGAGNAAFPRSVRLSVVVMTQQGATFDTSSIDGWFVTAGGERIEIPPGSCGHEALPSHLATDDVVEGCLAFLLPAEAGRLQLRGDGAPGQRLKLYLPVPAV